MEKSRGWTYQHFTDKEIIQYFIENPHPEFPWIVNKFHQMNFGAHKADLFRYYYLFLEGGVFLDSDAMIECDIEHIVKEYAFFSVKSYIDRTLFQGFIGCVSKHPIIYAALKDAYEINVDTLTKQYHLLTHNIYTFYHSFEGSNKVLYTELKSDEDKASTVDENENVILIHYWKDKKIPAK